MKTLMLSLLILVSQSLFANEPVSTSFWNNIAIGKHDSLGYYQPGLTGSTATEKGSENFVVEWQGAQWRFANQASADKFAQDPRAYAPRYNGHCANALSLGEGLINTDGKVWEFFGGKLHLFYAERGRQRWLKGDWQRYQLEADNAWQEELKRQGN